MTGFRPRQGSKDQSPASGKQPASLWQQGGRAVRRYLLISSGISSTALGLALIVSFVAATYGESEASDNASSRFAVEVSQLGERIRSTTLESTFQVVSPRMLPAFDQIPQASLAPPLDVEKTAEPETEEAAVESAPVETPAPAPPAAAIDAEETPDAEVLAAAEAQEAALVEEPEAKTPVENQIAPPGGLPSIGQIFEVNVTFYDCLVQGFCGAMYNGEPVYEGAAACSWDLPLGTRFAIEGDPTGRIYVCADRGILPDTWVDIYFFSPDDGWDWQQTVGRYATVYILSVPTFDPLS
jgi:hypothetical protein